MAKYAVVQTGGKQYLVQPNQEIVVEKVTVGDEKTIELPVLAVFDTEKESVELGAPTLKTAVKATVVEDLKGEKVRVAKFKSKVRYRKVTGFRAQLTKLKIGEI
jgi:large subunit ribosomal protein L21